MRSREAGAVAARAAARSPRLDSLLRPDRNSCPIAPIQNINLRLNKQLTTIALIVICIAQQDEQESEDGDDGIESRGKPGCGGSTE